MQPSTPQNTTIFTCVANDKDTRAPFNTVRYEMVLMNNNAGAFFDVKPNGDIVLTQSVLFDNENQYQVNLSQHLQTCIKILLKFTEFSTFFQKLT